MSCDILDENYYIKSGGKIPVKWTAPEVYNLKVFYKNSLIYIGNILPEILTIQ